ncbi:MAG: hypothetical protein IKF19_06030 [Bacilli bacterium]|nr:hypothetical protein [Bacilli bacterium]
MLILDIDQSCLNILSVVYFLRELLKIVDIIVPIGLIVMLSIDFFKGVISNEGGGNAFNLAIQRIISAIIILLIPTFIFGLFDALGIASKDSKMCWKYAGEVSVKEAKDVMATNIKELQKDIKKNRDSILSKLKLSDKKAVRQIVAASEDTNNSSNGPFFGKKYHFTNDELKAIAYLCSTEQGTPEGAAGEATLIANKYEMEGSNKGIYEYLRTSRWFAGAKRKIESPGKVSKKVLAAVKNVLVYGNRSFPPYVIEHDCWDCDSSSYCKNGNKGDICTITNDGRKYSKMSYIKNVENYHPDKTIIKNEAGATYTFYCFPSTAKNTDPFGYTEAAKKKYDKANK